ncbi:Protein downstream neighbor of son homolog [Geodia barretti]|uniref:Protein downstream neighbor of son homolog n=1 Tax=Geodia barretti TaxID=519541 RepID=A0AA35QXP5_GEOBA|nr:Protein downstream neighbor of son homolog [Geodia barretti]
MSAILQAERQTALGETSSSEGQEQRRWKKPNEVVRIRRKLSRKPSLKSIPGQRSESLREVTKRTTPVLKRTSENLAASTPPKRSRGGLQDISNSPVAPLRTPDKENLTLQHTHKDRDCITTENPPPTPSSPSGTAAAPPLPLDWALKTKVRLVSPFPFSWTQSLRPQQEACGLTNFLTSSGDQIHHQASCDRQEELQESLMMWVHPSLPFLKVFPRNNSTASDARQKIPHSTALLQDEQVLQALKDDWSELSHHLAPNLLFSPYLTPNFLPFLLSISLQPFPLSRS